MSINKNTSRCDGCRGIVKNVDGKRASKEKLAEVHNATCPGKPSR